MASTSFGFSHRLVNRDGADGNGRGIENGAPNRVDVSAGREIHHGVGAVVHGVMELFQLLIDVRLDRRIADVGVDLDLRNGTDPHRIQPPGDVVDIRRNDQTSPRHLVADQLRGEVLTFRDPLHRWSDGALTGKKHLRDGFHGSLRRS